MIPEGWEVKKLHEIVDFKNGKAHEKLIDINGSVIVVNSKFISTSGKVIKRTLKNICPVNKNDILMVMSDVPNSKAIAKCFFVNRDNKYSLNQSICSLTSLKLESKFLFYILNRNRYYLKFDDGIQQTNLRKDQVLNCPIQIPLKKEQQKIASILSRVDRQIQLTEETNAKTNRTSK